MQIDPPYLLFLGDAPDPLAAKTALGVAFWRPERCLGQLRLPGCQADARLPDHTLADARAAGARTLVIGVANRGGTFAPAWIAIMLEAIALGFDIASGLHDRVAAIPQVAAAAAAAGTRIFDVRHPDRAFPIADGKPRAGRRLLAVGTDCSIGKMYSTLALERGLKARGVAADFRATGQTGILIAGSGVSVDAVVSDFVAGAVEWLAPANDPEHWDLVEGQGSLFHPSYAGVTLGLIHGAQPDALVICHEPGRPHLRGLPHYPLPDLATCMELNLRCARLTNPDVRYVGVCLNTAGLPEAEAARVIERTAAETGLPCVDPVRTGVGPVIDRLLAG